MSDFESKLRKYSIGIVLEAKKRDSMFIKVYPIEELPAVNGKIIEAKVRKKDKAKNILGVEIDFDIEANALLIAKWLPSGEGNRITAPDVQPGETVIIYKYADREEYFWESREIAKKLRRLETVRYSFCNLSDGLAEVEYDDDSSYFIEISTHDKHIKIHTSKNDGEPVGYDFEFNTGQGTFQVSDTAGNYLRLDSQSGFWKMFGNSNIEFEAPKSIRFKTNTVINDSQLVHNLGDELTDGKSTANPHYNCV